jgi:predicted nucleic acid-binding protein
VLRAVLDTNVFVSSLLNKTGAPARLLDSWRAGEYLLMTSPPIVGEIKFLSCALEAGADVIVSGDRHLLGLKTFEGKSTQRRAVGCKPPE